MEKRETNKESRTMTTEDYSNIMEDLIKKFEATKDKTIRLRIASMMGMVESKRDASEMRASWEVIK